MMGVEVNLAEVLGYNLSPKKIEVLRHFLKYRGMTGEQLLCALKPDKFNRRELINTNYNNRPTQLRQANKYIEALREEGLLTNDTLYPKKRADYHYLTKDGFEIASTIHGVQIGKIGTGYNDDFGDFQYELHKPPHKQIHHHLRLIDFFLQLENVRSDHPELNIDYRDNRYVSDKYPLPKTKKGSKQKFKKFMPDGEVMLGNKRYWVEIDTGSERSDILTDKFEGYAQYIEHQLSNDNPIAEGILFISGTDRSSQYNRRWGTILMSFFKGIGDWGSSINLIAGTLSDVEDIVLREIQEGERFRKFVKDMEFYQERSRNYEGTNIIRSPLNKKGYKHSLSIRQNNQEPVAFVYERVDGYETRGLSRILEYSKVRPQELKKIKKMVPVLYYYGEERPPFNYNIFTEPEEAEKIFSNSLWVNLKDDPQFYNIDGEKVEVSNPFLL